VAVDSACSIGVPVLKFLSLPLGKYDTLLVWTPSRRKSAVSAEYLPASEKKLVNPDRPYQPNFYQSLAAEKQQLKFGWTNFT